MSPDPAFEEALKHFNPQDMLHLTTVSVLVGFYVFKCF